ncbi:MAG: hypothetical protein ACI82H_000337 [Alphaproteobacteria bacterium]|jgi:hypothetical protein
MFFYAFLVTGVAEVVAEVLGEGSVGAGKNARAIGKEETLQTRHFM